MSVRSMALVGSALAFLLLPAAAQAQRYTVPAEDREIAWTGNLPACETPRVLADIQTRFAAREAGYWNSPLRIVGYEKVRPVAQRPWGAAYIPRLYCSAVALVHDGAHVRKHSVSYVIAEGLGYAGWGWGVQWCVDGVIRHNHASPNCLLMKP